MSFRFNFDDSDNEDVPLKKIKFGDNKQGDVLPFSEVIPDFLLDEDVEISSYCFKDKSIIRCIRVAEDVSSDVTNSTTSESKIASDLVPRVYEGGFKVWECSLDLVNYIIDSGIDFKSKNVLELGCGCGIPGIHALRNSASSVHFQDYNADVLKGCTAPNVRLNADDIPDNVRYFSGDWSHFLEQDLPKYDLILSSETIYCPDSYEHLHRIFERFLGPEGTCLLAAKTFYFGVGGGTRDFRSFVKDRGVFDVDSTETFTEGVQREVLSLKFKKSSATDDSERTNK